MSAASLSAPRRMFPEYDEVLVWAVLALLAIGLVMVYSASIATAEGSKFTGFRSAYYLTRHSLFIFVGVMAGAAAFQVKVETWQKLAPYLFLLGVVLLVLVLIPGIGR
ncbi:MAG: FtsW/RodA/SpoVE family cell cycle protein, partial [Gallionellaceae bacterium]|nr:FtsW/RodA/SpoVE family cell cycle protein [Gallionellaceae bacterium]